MTSPGRRCVFFDRDGVVNRSPGEGYVLEPSAFHLNPGIADALRVIRERGALAVVVTSQKGVGKGLMTAADLERIHGHMAALLAAEGEAFDAVYAHLGTGGEGDFPPKPDPGMVFAAAERFGIDLAKSWIIGDADRDIRMGLEAGLAGTIRILGEKGVGVPATYTLGKSSEIPKILQSIL